MPFITSGGWNYHVRKHYEEFIIHSFRGWHAQFFFYSLVLEMEIKPDGAGISWRIESQEKNCFSPLRVYNTQCGMKVLSENCSWGNCELPSFCQLSKAANTTKSGGKPWVLGHQYFFSELFCIYNLSRSSIIVRNLGRNIYSGWLAFQITKKAKLKIVISITFSHNLIQLLEHLSNVA